jgi:hypothetical protein
MFNRRARCIKFRVVWSLKSRTVAGSSMDSSISASSLLSSSFKASKRLGEAGEGRAGSTWMTEAVDLADEDDRAFSPIPLKPDAGLNGGPPGVNG